MTDGRYQPDARGIPEAVLWSEGMLLSPQHFQLASRRAERLIAYTVGASLPYCWGLAELGVQYSSLAQGGVSRSSASKASCRTGLVVCHPLEDSLPLALDLKPHFDALRSGPCTVHLAVPVAAPGPARRSGHQCRGATARSCKRRWSTISPPTDRSTWRACGRRSRSSSCRKAPSRRSNTPRCRSPCLSLDENKLVAQGIRAAALAVDPRSVLYRPIAMAVERLRSKAATRANYLKSSGAGIFSLEALQLRALVAPLPMLEAMIEQGASHPYDVFLALAHAVGTLACLTGLNVPARLPLYEHADPLPAFKGVIAEIDSLIDQLEERFDKVPFENLGDGKFRLELKAAWLQEFLYVQLFAAPSQPLWQVEQWARHALIGDKDRMPQIREARALGAPRTLVERVDKIDLVRSSDAVLIRVPLRTPATPNGLQLAEHRTLEIQSEIPSDANGRPLRVVLYVLKSVPGAEPAPPGRP